MVTETKIGWTDCTVNPIRVLRLGPDGEPLDPQPGVWGSGVHCEHVTEECKFCWAEGENNNRGTRLPFKPGHRKNLRVIIDEKMLLSPLRRRKPSMIFPFSMTDLFLDFYDDETVARGIAMMVAARRHFFQPLTKRSARMVLLLNSEVFWDRIRTHALEILEEVKSPLLKAHCSGLVGLDGQTMVGPRNPPPNIMWGVSVGFQQAADRVIDLLRTPAALRNVSYEPALGPVDFTDICNGHFFADALAGTRWHDNPDGPNPQEKFAPGLDQIIFGGGGRGRQRCDVDWGRPALRACRAVGASFFMKQTGSNAFDRGIPIVLHGKDQKGAKDWNIPEDLRVREIPPAIAAWLTREVRA
jgi:protein gp37